jgi:hypothetical protein
VHQDVADVNADPEAHLSFGGSLRVLFIQRTLDGEATLDGVDDAGKFGDNAVPSRIEDSAAVLSDQTVYDLTIRGQRAQRADLVDAHKTAVAVDIGGENCGKPAFDLVSGHG